MTGRRIRVSLGLAAVLATAMGLTTPSAGAAQSKPATWSTYFYPRVVGYQCHESFASKGASGSETLTVAAVKKTSKGVNVTIQESGSAQAFNTKIPVNATLHYTLTKRGQLSTNPSAVGFAGRSGSVTGTTVFPSVASLVSGHTSTATFHETIPLTASDKRQLKGDLLPRQSSLKVNITLKNKGAIVPTLTLPIGPLQQLLRIDTSVKSVTVTNSAPKARKQLASALTSELKNQFTTSTWYARNIGPVQVTVLALTTQAASCAKPL